MITHDVYIKRARWIVHVYHSVDTMYADEILDELINIGCSKKNLIEASRMLWGDMTNCGLTFSNCKNRETIMVIGTTNSGSEYWNSIDHEKQHLLQDIATTDHLDPFGEEISYISGEFLRDVFDNAKVLLCDCCRKKVYRNTRML